MFKMLRDRFMPELDAAAKQELEAYKRQLAADAEVTLRKQLCELRVSYAMKEALRIAIAAGGAKNPTLVEKLVGESLDKAALLDAVKDLAEDKQEQAVTQAVTAAVSEGLSALQKSDSYLFHPAQVTLAAEEAEPFAGFDQPDEESDTGAVMGDPRIVSAAASAEKPSDPMKSEAAGSALGAAPGFVCSGAPHGMAAADLSSLSDEEYYRATAI